MKCPQCGYQPPRGRPKKLDDHYVRMSRVSYKWSVAKIAKKLKVTNGAIYASLARSR